MSTPIVGASGGTAAPGTTQTRASGTRDIGQDAFLKLLTEQLKNQDPTKPQDNGEFIAQLATFSSLEKLTTIATKLDQIGTALGITLPTDTSTAATSGTGTTTGTGNNSSSNGGK